MNKLITNSIVLFFLVHYDFCNIRTQIESMLYIIRMIQKKKRNYKNQDEKLKQFSKIFLILYVM